MTDYLPTNSGSLSQLCLSTEAIRQAPDFNAALELVLHQICAVTPWQYAEVWLPEADRHLLKLSPASCINVQEDDRGLALKQFRQCSEAFILQPGEGLPGYTWSSQRPQWIADVSAESETYFLRNQIAKAFGVKAGLGLPWLIDHEVVAVFVFFMQTARLADQTLIHQTEALLQQLEPAVTPFFQSAFRELQRP
ncbi:MAG TPA: GAF domain-containing protein [Microcoleaceae cyanobacterium]